MSWKKNGVDPDYRFSLANERTYLAWIRTAIAILAGAIAIDQLSLDLATPGLRIALSVTLCGFSAVIAGWAYTRWAQNERAMRSQEPLNYPWIMKVVSLIFGLISLVLMLFIVAG
ncbi:YidH family protein [Vibrio gazogenes]|uniref:DUF202 domain-containing protein n=2 Tax=Vibrio gazogenes TaxID=687 RepID=A0A1Z2SDU0_VIBGA|nr:DUF202 domain-containing protein [Vibrio gazogenes]ASA55335.1 hypothetical protein BSQ33_06075 [Vibrio gazogenes]USP13293.1 DUF202 domain-containing protein [Vibrio gazogenes]SHF27074.1 putative membrane protein [Vibrio gazogenes DSM 21264] [Vibrio gazogenes DSM 21264 = NBRC 103151]